MNGSDSILTRALSFLFQRAPGAVIRNLGGRRVRRRAGRWGVAPKGRSVRNARAVRPERKLKKKKPRKSLNLRGFVTAFGGDGGIRTLDPGFGPDAPLAGECLRPLGHVSQTFARTREAVRRERNNIGFRTARQFP